MTTNYCEFSSGGFDQVICNVAAAYTGGATGYSGQAELVVVTEGFYATHRTIDAWGTDVYGDGFCCSLDIPLSSTHYYLFGSELEDMIAAHDATRELDGPTDGSIDKLEMYGYDSNDQISGTASSTVDDCAFGGGHADAMATRGGLLNHYYGENGDDHLVGGSGPDTLSGGDGDDLLRGFGGNDILLGDNHGDTLYGGDGVDTMDGGADADTMFGEGDADIMTGGTGADTLYGDDGADALEGGDGPDHLYGGDDDDELDGDAGNDVLEGGDGIDTMSGGPDNDYVRGRGDNDNLYGDDGDDTLCGDGGADYLYGGADTDEYYGGSQRDTANAISIEYCHDVESVIGGCSAGPSAACPAAP
jgi:Ca2+-binding RTX toxin-like protein